MKRLTTLLFLTAVLLTRPTVPATAQTGSWDQARFPHAEALPKQELVDEFRWQPGESNRPIGVARGIYPGRVVLTRYPEVCRWRGRWQLESDQWFLPENTDLEGVCQMMSRTLQTLTGTKSDAKAWKRIFEYYHQQRFGTKKGGYRDGEVALESVGLDLLFAQSLRNTEPGYYDVPRILVRNQASDYLLEMADPQHAPSGTSYVQDGRPVESLGVFEHWDSPETMRYSRNLDRKRGRGIEFIFIPMGSARNMK